MRISPALAVACALAGLSALPAEATTTIGFENGVSPLAGFAATSELTTAYQSLGVTFAGVDRGFGLPSAGGHILDQGQNFGIPAHGGNDFLAFIPVPIGANPPQTSSVEQVTFTQPVSTFSIYLGSGYGGAGDLYFARALDGDGNFLVEVSAPAVPFQYAQLTLDGSIAGGELRTMQVVFGIFSTTSAGIPFVADDLSFDFADSTTDGSPPSGSPDPAALGMAEPFSPASLCIFFGGLVAAVASRRRTHRATALA
jgi:hypothetical protein